MRLHETNNFGESYEEVYEPIDESYEDIYDEDGYYASVECKYCGEDIKFKDGKYICPNCNNVIDRLELFNAIGAEPLGPECLNCNNLYPGCISCPHGYVDDDDIY